MFSENLGKCTKVKTIYRLKETVVPVFKPKRCMPFAVVEPISKNLTDSKFLGVISPTDYSECEIATVYVKKKNNIRVCVDFSTGLNEFLLLLHIYP